MEKPPSEQGTRLQFADGLRGFAIILVLLRHFYMHAYDRGFPRWADILGLTYVGVHLFLPLSGFSLAWAYLGPKKRKFELRDFAFRRVTRILPVYYAGILLALPINLYLPAGELFFQILTHALFIHNLFPQTVISYNGPFWSLALEVQLYFLFPLMLLGGLRYGFARMLMCVFALQMAYRFTVIRWGTDYNGALTFVLPWGTLGRMFGFAMGVSIAAVIAHWMQKPPPQRVRTLLTLAGAVLFCLGILLKRKIGVVHPFTDLSISLCFVCCILAASGGNGILARFANWRPLCKVGLMSYSIFVVHALVLGYLTHPLHNILGQYVGTLGLLPFVVLPAVGASWLFYRFIEKPLSDYFYGLRKRREARTESVSVLETSSAA